MIKKICYTLLLLLLNIYISKGEKYYVSMDGDAANTGKSVDSAWGDVQEAISQILPYSGDTIIIMPGQYEISSSIVLPVGINLLGGGNKREETILRSTFVSSEPLLKMMAEGKLKSTGIVDGNQFVDNITFDGDMKNEIGIFVSHRNHVKIRNVYIFDFIAHGLVFTAGGASYSHGFTTPKISGAEIAYCKVLQSGRLIPGSNSLYSGNVEVAGWEGGSIHHCHIADTVGNAGEALKVMGCNYTKIHDNHMKINVYITNHWGGVFSVLTGYTAGVEFYNNKVNSGISCEHRVEEETMQIPGVKSMMIYNNHFYSGRPDGRVPQGIELYPDNIEIYGNFFDGISSPIQTWLGTDTLNNVLIHHNVFKGVDVTGAINFRRGCGDCSNIPNPSVWKNIRIYNNVFDNFQYAIFNDAGEPLGFDIKNNVFMNISSSIWRNNADDEVTDVIFSNNLAYNYTRLQNGNSAVFENTTTGVQPGFPMSGDFPDEYYAPSSGESNLVDAGTIIEEIFPVYTGSAPDLGAYEFNGQVPYRLLAPVLEPEPGIYNKMIDIQIINYWPGSEIYYTLDGTEPVPGDPGTLLYDGNPIDISGDSAFIQVIAHKEGMINSYIVKGKYYIETEKVTKPQFSHTSGTYHQPVFLSMESSTVNAKIYYRTDGFPADPVYGILYTAPLYVKRNMNFNAIAVKEGMANSGREEVELDIDIVLPEEEYVIINDSSSSIIYEPDYFWQYKTDEAGNDYLNDYHIAYADGATFKFTFHGTGFVLIARKNSLMSARAEVYLDDELMGIVSFNAGTTVYMDTVLMNYNMKDTIHELKIHSPDGSNGYLSVDAIAVYGFKPLETSVLSQYNDNRPVLYPNPVNRKLFLSNKVGDGLPVHVTISDMVGRVCFKNEVKPPYIVDVASLPNGIYLIAVEGEKIKTNTRFIKTE